MTVKDGLIYEILKDSTNTLYYYRQSTYEQNNNLVYGINEKNNQLEILYESDYKKTDKEYNDPVYNNYIILDSYRNIFVKNKFRSIIYTDYIDNDGLGDEFLKLANEVCSYVYNPVNNIYKYTNLYNQLLYYSLYSSNLQQYNRINKLKYIVPYTFKNKYNVVKIPRELLDKFYKIKENFEEVKKLLKYNDETGFYYYTINNEQVPIICKHEYMTLCGINLENVSEACYLNGKCKYCGQEMIAYHEKTFNDLPLSVYSLIHKYISDINENIDEELLFNVLTGILQSIYDKLTNRIKNNESFMLAFSSLFILKIYNLSSKDIIYKSKPKFKDLVNTYIKSFGWNDERINELLNNEVFSYLDNSNIVELIKKCVFISNIEFIEVLPISILFNEMIDMTKETKLNATNKIQKLFIENNMISLWNEIYKHVRSLWKFNNYIIKSNELSLEYKLPIIIVYKDFNVEHFFNIMNKYYCPVNYLHTFVKNTCKYCGLNKDLKNSNEILKKYKNNINVKFVNDYRNIDIKYKEKNIINDINKTDISNVKKYFINEEYRYDYLMNNIKKFTDEIIKLLKNILHIYDDIEIKNKDDFIIKCIVYIMNNKIMLPSSILDELEYIIVKIDNISLIYL